MTSSRSHAVALWMLFACASASAQPLTLPYVGAVTDSTAVIAMWVSSGSSLRMVCSKDPNVDVRIYDSLVFAARDTMFKFHLSGLEPDTKYYYRYTTSTYSTRPEPRSFNTFPRSSADAGVSFWFGSCQQSRANDSGAVFGRVTRDGGNLFVQMGDWAYPDVHIPTYPTTDSSVVISYRLRLDTVYPFTYRVLDRMPVAYVWDDHDSFGNNSDGASASDVRERVLRAYREHVPHYPLPNASSGIWQRARLANVELFLLDSRSQRSPIDSAIRGNRYEPPPGHSMLAGFPVGGVDQRTWLLDALRRSTARWKVIVSPVPFNPAMQPGITAALFLNRPDIAKQFAEYWAGYPADIDSLTVLLRSPAGRNVVIVSGSAHTNMYDNGSHSVVPEFVAANLDIPNSNLRDLLQSYGLNVWTAGQTGSNSTVGRIRVETTPVHRLTMESFDEAGELELQYSIVDSNAGGAIININRELTRSVRADVSGRTLTVFVVPTSPNAPVVLSLYDVSGSRVLRHDLPAHQYKTEIALPETLTPGVYLGDVDDGGEPMRFRVMVGE